MQKTIFVVPKEGMKDPAARFMDIVKEWNNLDCKPAEQSTFRHMGHLILEAGAILTAYPNEVSGLEYQAKMYTDSNGGVYVFAPENVTF